MYYGIVLRFGNKLPFTFIVKNFEKYAYEIVDVVNAVLGMAS